MLHYCCVGIYDSIIVWFHSLSSAMIEVRLQKEEGWKHRLSPALKGAKKYTKLVLQRLLFLLMLLLLPSVLPARIIVISCQYERTTTPLCPVSVPLRLIGTAFST